MKALIALLLGAFLMPGMTGTARAEDERTRLDKRFEVLMTTLADRPETVPRMTVSGTELVVGSHRITVSPVSEQVLRTGDKFISAARFEINLDGVRQDQLVGSAIGTGSSADEATSVAIEEWYMQFGKALLLRISDGKPDTVLGAFKVNSGLVGIRGQAPAEISTTNTFDPERILAAISSNLPRADGNLHAVHFYVAIVPGKSTKAECKIDGRDSAGAAEVLQAMAWPAGTYMYKQSYALK